MDKRLQLIAHLYEEDLDGLEPLETLLEDPELRTEYRILRESRFALDHRRRARPDPGSIDAVLQAAGPLPAHDRRWTDRGPLRLVRSRRLMASALAVAAVLLVAIAIYPIMGPVGVDSETQLAAKSEENLAHAERFLRSLPPAPATGLSAAPQPTELASADMAAEPEAEGGSTSVPAWDTGRDVRQISRRIEALKAAGLDSWDSPAVPLEMLPTDPGSDMVRPADSRGPGQ